VSSTRPRSVAFDTALTGIATAMTMVSGGIFALLIAARFGSDARTDGFFAAYGLYTVAVLVAQSMRTTIVGRLVDGETRFAGFDAFLAAVGVLALAGGVLFVALGEVLAELLTEDPTSRATASDALRLLWPAATLQLVAALAAAMLGVLGDFGRAALALGAGSLTSIVAFLALAPALEIDAISVGLVIGAVVTAVPLVASLARVGWRPRRRGSALRGAGLVLLGAGPVALAQVVYLVSAAAAARGDAGSVTVYSYGYFAHGLVLALLASSVSIVLAAPIAATWDRDVASLRPHIETVLRAGLVLLVPAVAAVALLGHEVTAAALPKFSDAQVDDIVGVFLALAPAVVFTQAIAVPLVALFAQGDYAKAAGVGVPVVILHAVVSLAIAGTDLVTLALVASGTSLVFSTSLAAALFGRATGGFLLLVGREIATVGLAGAVAFGVAELTLGGVGDVAVLVAGGLAFAAIVAVLLPHHRAVVLRLVGRSSG
jgi:peptidoglycan biosynthesis protein MviN/MurJ (putative lipid II flippase)